MITMNVAITFFLSSVIACVCFSLGKFVGKLDSEHEQKIKNDSNKVDIDLSNFSFKEHYEDHPEPGVIDAEFEDVVYNLQAYKEKKNRERLNEINAIANYEVMFSKRDRQFIKMPKEVADLIRHLKRKS